MDVEAVAAQDNPRDVLSYVMYVSLDGGQHDLRLCRSGTICLSCIHIWLQNGDGISHDLSRLYYLGQEHLSFSEHVTYCFHSLHQRPFDNLYGTAVFLQDNLYVFSQRPCLSFYQSIL